MSEHIRLSALTVTRQPPVIEQTVEDPSAQRLFNTGRKWRVTRSGDDVTICEYPAGSDALLLGLDAARALCDALRNVTDWEEPK